MKQGGDHQFAHFTTLEWNLHFQASACDLRWNVTVILKHEWKKLLQVEIVEIVVAAEPRVFNRLDHKMSRSWCRNTSGNGVRNGLVLKIERETWKWKFYGKEKHRYVKGSFGEKIKVDRRGELLVIQRNRMGRNKSHNFKWVPWVIHLVSKDSREWRSTERKTVLVVRNQRVSLT